MAMTAMKRATGADRVRSDSHEDGDVAQLWTQRRLFMRAVYGRPEAARRCPDSVVRPGDLMSDAVSHLQQLPADWATPPGTADNLAGAGL